MDSKLAFLAAKEQSIASNVQAEATTLITQKVLDIFTTDNKDKKALKEKVLTENISKLESI